MRRSLELLPEHLEEAAVAGEALELGSVGEAPARGDAADAVEEAPGKAKTTAVEDKTGDLWAVVEALKPPAFEGLDAVAVTAQLALHLGSKGERLSVGSPGERQVVAVTRVAGAVQGGQLAEFFVEPPIHQVTECGAGWRTLGQAAVIDAQPHQNVESRSAPTLSGEPAADAMRGGRGKEIGQINGQDDRLSQMLPGMQGNRAAFAKRRRRAVNG